MLGPRYLGARPNNPGPDFTGQVLCESYYLAMAIEGVDEFTPVVSKLRGSHLRIPNLNPIYGRWRQGFNFRYGRLVRVIDRQLEASFQDKAYVKCVKSMDLAQFVCQ